MNTLKRKAIGLGVLGLALIILGIKYLSLFLSLAGQQVMAQDGPMILFFNVEEPCECMLELAESAEQQIASWPPEQRGKLPVVHIWMNERKDLEAKYKVFRAPCLILVNAQGQVIWRQDYPLIQNGPFDLVELEAVIAKNE
jgi:hypothetical protein